MEKETKKDKKILDLLNKEEINKEEWEQFKEFISKREEKEKELEEELKHQVAELRNVTRRRDEKESEIRKYSSQKLGELIIPNIDLFKKVLESSESIENNELKNYLQGFQMIATKMDDSLSEVGINEFKPEIGSEFDSKMQESIEQIETSDYKTGQIVNVVSNGYMIYDRVLIHAKVKVAK